MWGVSRLPPPLPLPVASRLFPPTPGPHLVRSKHPSVWPPPLFPWLPPQEERAGGVPSVMLESSRVGQLQRGRLLVILAGLQQLSPQSVPSWHRVSGQEAALSWVSGSGGTMAALLAVGKPAAEYLEDDLAQGSLSGTRAGCSLGHLPGLPAERNRMLLRFGSPAGLVGSTLCEANECPKQQPSIVQQQVGWLGCLFGGVLQVLPSLCCLRSREGAIPAASPSPGNSSAHQTGPPSPSPTQNHPPAPSSAKGVAGQAGKTIP